MEATGGLPAICNDAKTIKYYYSKRNESVPIELMTPPLARQMLSIADSTYGFTCNGRYEPGSFYEIDHEKLPPKSPIQLKAVRVVMVSESTLLDVTVSFPSTLSLRSYFAGAARIRNSIPELDERFVMSSNQAGRILRWRIPPAQLEAGMRLKNFWLLSPASVADLPPDSPKEMLDDSVVSKTMKAMSSCLMALNCAQVVGWGIRRKVKYIGRHCEPPALEMQEEQESCEGRKRTREEAKINITEIKMQKNKKKKRKGDVRERDSKIRRVERNDVRCVSRGTKDRWSTERYEAAEKRLLEIMRAKKAELGMPILRQALREEARKHIGDTGLLDHLLKHMSGKIVSNGTERFRRRHNSEGAMEYWLEPADLVEMRRKAGVDDPFWVPPPGWKLGDSIFPNSCGPDCKITISELKQQLTAQFRRYEEQQTSLQKLEKETRDMQEETEKAIAGWQEKCQILLEQKAKQEAELAALSDCMQGLKEEVRLLKEKQKREDAELTVKDVSNTVCNDGGITNATAEFNSSYTGSMVKIESGYGCCSSGSKKAARRSGFRICKPQGTFLWPSMAAAGTGASASSGLIISSRVPISQSLMVPTATVPATEDQHQQQQHLMLFPGGGPPSASSSTASTPKLLLLPAPGPTSPAVQPRASEVVAVPAQQEPGRGACSSGQNLCAAQHSSTPRVQTTASLMHWVGDDAVAAVSSPWKKGAAAVWGSGVMITTDLALATPSPYR